MVDSLSIAAVPAGAGSEELKCLERLEKTTKEYTMGKPHKLLCMAVVSGFLAGCSTTGHFVVPEGSRLYLHERPEPVQVQNDGTVSTTPFFWTAVAGIRYRLEKDGMATKEGKLPAKFRVVSIFWPPYAIVYWPMGLNPDITYDLIKNK